MAWIVVAACLHHQKLYPHLKDRLKYVLGSHGPYSQLNPVKIFANLSGIALILGSLLLIKNRLKSTDAHNFYFDWYILALALGLGVTGMLTQFIRLADWPMAAVSMYFIHLVLTFNLIACLPYSKMAHLVYRTVALAYVAYVDGRPQT